MSAEQQEEILEIFKKAQVAASMSTAQHRLAGVSADGFGEEHQKNADRVQVAVVQRQQQGYEENIREDCGDAAGRFRARSEPMLYGQS